MNDDFDRLTRAEKRAYESGEWLAPKTGSHIPDRWPYFLGRLAERGKGWDKVTIGGCVKIAQETSLGAVTMALAFAHESPPKLKGSAYGWLKAAAADIEEKGSR